MVICGLCCGGSYLGGVMWWPYMVACNVHGQLYSRPYVMDNTIVRFLLVNCVISMFNFDWKKVSIVLFEDISHLNIHQIKSINHAGIYVLFR